MTQADPVAVAEGLTPSVRDFVLMPLYSVHCEGISAAWLCDTGYWAGREVKRLGLATRQPIYPGTVASIPTPLGLAVRAALLNEDRRP